MYFVIDRDDEEQNKPWCWIMYNHRNRIIAISEKRFRTKTECKKEIEWIKDNAEDADID